MDTKAFIIAVTALFATLNALAREKEGYASAGIKVSYEYHFFTVRGTEVRRPMILTFNNDKSKFYNPDTNRIDSICNSPEGRAEYDKYINSIEWTRETIKNMPARWEKMYVEKNRVNNEMTVYDTVAGEDRYNYTEALGDIDWELADSVSNILGYDCLMAECDYHGRHWTVWFTTEVPVSEGPWKLHGLPGLILKAEETDGFFEFTATGIESYENVIEPVYEKSRYEKTDRIELYKTKRIIDENFGGFVSARFGTTLPSDMKSTQMAKEYDYIETDYRE